MNSSTENRQANANRAGQGRGTRVPRQLSEKTMNAVANMSRSMEGLTHAERQDALKMLLSLENLHPVPIGVGTERKSTGIQNNSSLGGGSIVPRTAGIVAKSNRPAEAVWKKDKSYMDMVDQHKTIVNEVKAATDLKAKAEIVVRMRSLEDQMKTRKKQLVGNGLGSGI